MAGFKVSSVGCPRWELGWKVSELPVFLGVGGVAFSVSATPPPKFKAVGLRRTYSLNFQVGLTVKDG